MRVQKIAREYIKANLLKAGFEIVRDNGPKLGVKAKSGKEYAIFVQGLNRDKVDSTKIHTREFKHRFRPDVWIALVVLFEDTEPVDYLIPTTVFEEPDKYVFFHYDLSDKHDYYSNVEINVFSDGAAILREYAFAYQVEKLK